MAKVLTMYQCSYCDHTLKTEKGIEAHEKKCTNNPTVLNIEKTIEDIRCTSTSIVEVIERLKVYLLTLGIKLHLTDYPRFYTEKANNTNNTPSGYSHRSRDNPCAPFGYPGWTGRWKGSIELVDTSILGTRAYTYFSSLICGDVKKELKLPFIHIGSGGSGRGESFSYEGTLFVYDFPKIHEKYIAEGGAISQLTTHYTDVVDTYYDKLSRERDRTVSKDPLVREFTALRKKSIALAESAAKAIALREEKAKAEFNEAYAVQLPLPPDPFCINSVTLQKIQCATFSTTAENPVPTLSAYVEQVNAIVDRMAALKTENPEYFL